WPGESAVGQYLRLMGETAPRTVIGVVTDAGGSGPVEMAYLPYGQEHPASSVPVILHVEPHGDGAGIADVVTLQLRRELPSVVEPRMRSIEGQFASATRQTTVAAGVSSGMSGVALLLTATGVFSGVSYSASRRQREWAIRLAMGARPRAVVRHAVSDGMAAAGLGGLSGAAVAFGLLSGIRGAVGASADEALAAVLAILIVLLIVAAAVALPAVRAAQT